MRLRVWTAATIFVGSYLPLAIILLAQDFDYSYLKADICLRVWSADSRCVLPFEHPELSITVFVLCVFCLALTLFVLKVVETRHTIKVISCTYLPSELMNYTLPYVVSFMGVGYNETGKFVGILVFLAWMFWITHKSGQIILNPALTAFGWRLYEIEYSFTGSDKELRKSLALIHGDPEAGALAKHAHIQDIMIVRPEKGSS